MLRVLKDIFFLYKEMNYWRTQNTMIPNTTYSQYYVNPYESV